jgi:hypothetical protein
VDPLCTEVEKMNVKSPIKSQKLTLPRQLLLIYMSSVLVDFDGRIGHPPEQDRRASLEAVKSARIVGE